MQNQYNKLLWLVSQDECTIPKWLLYGSLLTKEFDHMAEAKKMVNIKGPGIRQFFLMCAMWIWLWINTRTPNVQQVGSFAKVDVSQLQCFIILNILNHQQIYQMLHFILKLTVHPQSLSHHILSQKKRLGANHARGSFSEKIPHCSQYGAQSSRVRLPTCESVRFNSVERRGWRTFWGNGCWS